MFDLLQEQKQRQQQIVKMATYVNPTDNVNIVLPEIETQSSSLAVEGASTNETAAAVNSSSSSSSLIGSSLPLSSAPSPNSVVAAALGEPQPAAQKRPTPFTGLDDILFNLADIPVESYSARQRCTINSEHQKEEARAKRQREREAERQQQAAAAAAASAQHSLHAAAAVAGVHHAVAQQHHPGGHPLGGNAPSASHPAVSVPNPYTAHPLHYGGAAAAAALHHLQPHHPHVQEQQAAVQYQAHHQQQQHLLQQQQQQYHQHLQAQIAAADAAAATVAAAAAVQSPQSNAYLNYAHNMLPGLSPDYGVLYNNGSAQMHQAAHHGAAQLPLPPPAHQQLQAPPSMQQQLHGLTMPPLPHQPLHQQQDPSALGLQQQLK